MGIGDGYCDKRNTFSLTQCIDDGFGWLWQVW